MQKRIHIGVYLYCFGKRLKMTFYSETFGEPYASILYGKLKKMNDAPEQKSLGGWVYAKAFIDMVEVA